MEIGEITSTYLGFHPRSGQLTWSIAMKFGCSRQAYGGYCFQQSHIEQILKALKIKNWEELIGLKVRSDFYNSANNKLTIIGHWHYDSFFSIEKGFHKLEEKEVKPNE